MKGLILSVGLLAAGLLLAASSWLFGQSLLFAQPETSGVAPRGITASITNAAANPPALIAGSPTPITFSAQIDPVPLSNTVNLLRLGAAGAQPVVVGIMHDDGLNGDLVAGDRTYSLLITPNEAIAGEAFFQVSAAFSGALKRSTSTPINLQIWRMVTDASRNLRFGLASTAIADLSGLRSAPVTILQSSPAMAAEPPLYQIGIFDVAGANPGLSAAISQRFGSATLKSATPLAGGVLVETDGLIPWHYIRYSSTTNRAVDVFGFQDTVIDTPEFEIFVQSMSF